MDDDRHQVRASIVLPAALLLLAGPAQQIYIQR